MECYCIPHSVECHFFDCKGNFFHVTKHVSVQTLQHCWKRAVQMCLQPVEKNIFHKKIPWIFILKICCAGSFHPRIHPILNDFFMIINNCTWNIRKCSVHISIKNLMDYMPSTSDSLSIWNHIFNRIINLWKLLWISISYNNFYFW